MHTCYNQVLQKQKVRVKRGNSPETTRWATRIGRLLLDYVVDQWKCQSLEMAGCSAVILMMAVYNLFLKYYAQKEGVAIGVDSWLYDLVTVDVG